MGRISIDVTDEEHKKLKAVAALRGKSIKGYVLERTLATDGSEDASLRELEELMGERIHAAKAGTISRKLRKPYSPRRFAKRLPDMANPPELGKAMPDHSCGVP